MDVKIVKSVKDDFCEQSGLSTVTHAFLSLDSMLFELGRFYEGPHMNVNTGKRLEKIHEFGKIMQKSAPVENGKNFEVQAAKDGLWLHFMAKQRMGSGNQKPRHSLRLRTATARYVFIK